MNKNFKTLIAMGLIGSALAGTANASVIKSREQEDCKEELPVFMSSFDRAELFIANTLYQAGLREQERIAEEQRKAEEERQLLAIKQEHNRKLNVGFTPYNLLVPSGITGDEMYALLSHRGVRDVAYTLVEAEHTYGVNALLLAGLVCLESGWGESDRSTGWTHNMTGMNVPTDDSIGTIYESRQACVLDTARQLKKYYLTEGASYYNGVSIWNVNLRYSASDTWAPKIIEISETLLSTYRETFLDE